MKQEEIPLDYKYPRGETILHIVSTNFNNPRYVEYVEICLFHSHCIRFVLSSYQSKPDINCRCSSGWTSLHDACAVGNLKVVAALVQYGAELHAVNKDGLTALHYLCKSVPQDKSTFPHEFKDIR